MEINVDLKRSVRQHKALSNEYRLALFLRIVAHEQQHGREAGCMVSEVVSDWKICAATVSHHIRILESAELIDVKKEGKYLLARINANTFQTAMRLYRMRPEDGVYGRALDLVG